MPCVAALSGCVVTSPAFFRPRAFAVAICFSLRPIRLLTSLMVRLPSAFAGAFFAGAFLAGASASAFAAAFLAGAFFAAVSPSAFLAGAFFAAGFFSAAFFPEHSALVMVLLYWSRGLYNPSRLRGLWQRSTTIAFGNALGVVGFMALLFVFRLQNFSRGVMLLLYGFSTGFLIFKRMIKRWYDRARNRKGEDLRHILLVGGGDMAAEYLLALEHNPYYGFHVDGYLAPYANPDLDVRYLGGYDKMEVTLDEPGIDEVVVALDAAEMHMLTRAFAACDKHGTRITMVPFYNDYLPARPTIDVLGDCKLINIRQTPFDNILNAFIKRAMDVVGSLVLIVLTSPIMLGVAIGVKLSSPGPIIFKQERVGLNKRPFMMYKFRSMRVNAAEDSAWSTNSDPRKTRFGSIIRKFSLDELPQFFNVLKGDMSLVGPRPEIPFHVEHFKEEIPRYLVRQQVRPGLTGWAQINGLRGDTDIAERIRYDIWYIENWTVALDIKILFRTVFGGKMVNDEKIQ